MNLPFNGQLMCYKVGSDAVAGVLLTVPCVFRKFEVGTLSDKKWR